MIPCSAQTLILEQLAEVIAQRQGASTRRAFFARPEDSPTNGPAAEGSLVDRLLGKFGSGQVVEWIDDSREAGSGAFTLALAVACHQLRSRGAERTSADQEPILAVIDPERTFHPPALVGMWASHRLLVIHPHGVRDTLWTWEQVLRSVGMGLIAVGSVDRLHSAHGRRLRLAAETSGCGAMLARPASALQAPSAAHRRFRVTPEFSSVDGSSGGTRRLRLACIKGTWEDRALGTQRDLCLEIDHETLALRLVDRLAHPAASAS